MEMNVETQPPCTRYQYLPDELLIEVLSYIPRDAKHQYMLAAFCAVNRQWYDVGISILYEAPHLWAAHFSLFVRTLCPSINTRIRKSELAHLVKSLNLSRIVHESTKAVTARLLARTKGSLEVFVAPQASFAINCWASLSKCTRLRVLDLTLISEAINFQNLNHCLKGLGGLERLMLPRCSSHYIHHAEGMEMEKRLIWPPRLEHLTLSGSVRGKFLWDMTRQPETFPPTLYSMSMVHCPGLRGNEIKSLLENLGETLTTVELCDLPAVNQRQFNNVLNWLPNLHTLSIAVDFIDMDFGSRPLSFTPSFWPDSKPLQNLTLLTSSGRSNADPENGFSISDLYDLVETRFLGRLRRLAVGMSTGWGHESNSEELEALAELIVYELDKENWENRRWHYEGLGPVGEGMTYREWINTTELGKKMRAMVIVLENR